MNADHLGSFAVNIDTLKAELIGAVLAVEIAYQNYWGKLWLETDSQNWWLQLLNQILLWCLGS